MGAKVGEEFATLAGGQCKLASKKFPERDAASARGKGRQDQRNKGEERSLIRGECEMVGLRATEFPDRSRHCTRNHRLGGESGGWGQEKKV